MKIIEVNNKKDWKLFHQAALTVYANDKNWIAPLRAEVEGTFNPDENVAMRHGEAQCYVLVDEKGRPVGRIAAFLDYERNGKHSIPEGGIGFFECLDKEEYAEALFEVAEDFLRERGVKVIDGPINFGQRDKYWGLLVHGFDPPLYQENYNPAYYQRFFVNRGYIPFEQILTYAGDSQKIPFQRLAGIAKRLQQRQPMYVRAFNYKQVGQFARDFTVVYNASFAEYEHFNPITEDLVLKMMEQAKPIIDPNLACIAYYDDEPAGFIVLYPDINPLLKHAKGKLNWMTIPRFLWKKRQAKTFNAKGMGFGIHPKYQSKGIFALLVDYLCSERNLERYPFMYLATIRTHNHQIRSIYDKLGVHIDRIHVTYRKALDPAIEVVPFEFLSAEDIEKITV